MRIPKVIVKPALVFAVGGLGFSLLAPVALFAGFSRFAGPILFGLFIAVVPLFLGAVLMIPNRSGGKAPTRAMIYFGLPAWFRVLHTLYGVAFLIGAICAIVFSRDDLIGFALFVPFVPSAFYFMCVAVYWSELAWRAEKLCNAENVE